MARGRPKAPAAVHAVPLHEFFFFTVSTAVRHFSISYTVCTAKHFFFWIPLLPFATWLLPLFAAIFLVQLYIKLFPQSGVEKTV